MVSDRPYRAGLPREEALRRMRANAGKQWDPHLVQLFLALLDRGLMEKVAGSQLAASA